MTYTERSIGMTDGKREEIISVMSELISYKEYCRAWIEIIEEIEPKIRALLSAEDQSG